MGHVWELCRLVKSPRKFDDTRVLDSLIDDTLRKVQLSGLMLEIARLRAQCEDALFKIP
jgi:hypothetical protein